MYCKSYFFRTINTLVETAASLVLLLVGLVDSRQDQFVVSPTFCRDIDTLVETSMSVGLLFCRATNIAAQSSVSLALPLLNSQYSNQEQFVVSSTFLGLLMSWSRDYRNDRQLVIGEVIVISNWYGYSNLVLQRLLSNNQLPGISGHYLYLM